MEHDNQISTEARDLTDALEKLDNGLENCIFNARERNDAYDAGYMTEMLNTLRSARAILFAHAAQAPQLALRDEAVYSVLRNYIDVTEDKAGQIAHDIRLAAKTQSDSIYNLLHHALMYLAEGESHNAKRGIEACIAILAAPAVTPAPQRGLTAATRNLEQIDQAKRDAESTGTGYTYRDDSRGQVRLDPERVAVYRAAAPAAAPSQPVPPIAAAFCQAYDEVNGPIPSSASAQQDEREGGA